MIIAAIATTLAVLAPLLYVAIMASLRADRRRERWRREAPEFWRKWGA